MSGLFKELSPADKILYRQWARDNYKPGADINAAWHPVVQHECHAINTETDNGL